MTGLHHLMLEANSLDEVGTAPDLRNERGHPLIHNSRLYLVDRRGHWAQLEHAKEFSRVVADFAGTGT